jgi:hypothetical protein
MSAILPHREITPRRPDCVAGAAKLPEPGDRRRRRPTRSHRGDAQSRRGVQRTLASRPGRTRPQRRDRPGAGTSSRRRHHRQYHRRGPIHGPDNGGTKTSAGLDARQLAGPCEVAAQSRFKASVRSGQSGTAPTNQSASATTTLILMIRRHVVVSNAFLNSDAGKAKNMAYITPTPEQAQQF